MNEFGQHRKKPRPTDIKSFQVGELDGIKVLKEPSNDTATVIREEGPALVLEITQALRYCQGSASRTGATVSCAAVRAKFPLIDKYFDDRKIERLTISEAGKISPRKEAVNAITDITQIPQATVERYFRSPTSPNKPHRA